MSKQIASKIVTIDSDLVVGQRVSGTSTITWSDGTTTETPWGGIYDGRRPSQHDGSDCVYFTDGFIGAVPQGLHGFPVDQIA